MSLTVKELIGQLKTFPEDSKVRLAIEETNGSLSFDGLGTAECASCPEVNVVFIVSLARINKHVLYALEDINPDASEKTQESKKEIFINSVKKQFDNLTDKQKKLFKEVVESMDLDN